MQDDTKDMLKQHFWSKRKEILESLTLGWDWTKETPFIMKRTDGTFYVWNEYSILKSTYGQYKFLGQRLANNNIDEVDIEIAHGEKITVYFDLNEVF